MAVLATHGDKKRRQLSQEPRGALMAQRRFLERMLRRGLRRKPGRVALDLAPGLPERDVARAAELLRLVTGLEGGVKFLVDLRADVLRLANGDDVLTDLDRELKAQIATLFDVGLLTLRRITWDAPAALLEKLIAYEAVHA